jgi:ATP-binding cassette, subfamily C (CFTR/MRP), member 1
MSDPEKKDLEPADNIAAAVEPTNEDRRTDPDDLREGIDEKGDEKIEQVKDSDDESSNGAELQPTKTSLSATTTATRTISTPAPHPKPWYKQINPLRWGEPSQVPETRQISREHQAGFFSLLTFQWMAPLMTVSSFRRSLVQR